MNEWLILAPIGLLVFAAALYVGLRNTKTHKHT